MCMCVCVCVCVCAILRKLCTCNSHKSHKFFQTLLLSITFLPSNLLFMSLARGGWQDIQCNERIFNFITSLTLSHLQLVVNSLDHCNDYPSGRSIDRSMAWMFDDDDHDDDDEWRHNNEICQTSTAKQKRNRQRRKIRSNNA